jgi:chromosome segregation ATPase
MASSFRTRRRPVELEEVVQIANEMTADGTKVTALGVLDKLGGGSLKTIYNYLDEWEKNRKATPSVSTLSEVPEVVKASFASLLASTWKAAAAEAAKEVTAAKERAESEVTVASSKFEGALEVIQRFEADAERDAATIEDLRSKLQNLEQTVGVLSQEKAAAQATSDELRHQVKSLETELNRLHDDHQRERQADRQAHKEQIEKLASEHAAAQNKTTEQIERLHKEKEEVQRQAEQTERDRHGLQVRLEQTEKQAEVTQKARDQVAAERDKFSQEAAQLRGTLEAQSVQLERLLSEKKQ